jgi:hypothetical protein
MSKEAELKVAEKELNKTLSWALNKKLQHRYQELFKRLDLSDQVVAAHSRNPGFEVVELLERLYNKRGRDGLHEFYELLQELEEQASLDLIDNNKVAVILFRPNDATLPQATTQPVQFVDVPIVPTHHVPQSNNNNNSNQSAERSVDQAASVPQANQSVVSQVPPGNVQPAPETFLRKQSKMAHKDIKILFLYADPKKMYRDSEQEIKEVRENLKGAKRVKLEVANTSLTTSNIQKYLLEHNPTVLHFCGHGTAAKELVFCNENGDQTTIEPSAIGNLFKLFKNIKLVVLSACYSEGQAQEIAKHIPLVVGNPSTIAIDDACKFSAGFYLALGYGKNAEDCLEHGKAQILLDNSKATIQDKWMPTLLKSSNSTTLLDPLETLDEVDEDERYDIGNEIAECDEWDQLGLKFKEECDQKTFSRAFLRSKKGNHSTDSELARYLVDVLAGRCLPIAAFKRGLLACNMKDIVKRHACFL